MSQIPISPNQKMNLPNPGDLFRTKQELVVSDHKNKNHTIPKGSILSLVSIEEAPSMRLNRQTKFISNLVCVFFYDKCHFKLTLVNTAKESSLDVFFELLTENNIDN